MAMTVNKWRDEIRAVAEREGGAVTEFQLTRGTHQRAVIAFPEGRAEVVVSLSPSDHRARHRVRGDIRRARTALKESA